MSDTEQATQPSIEKKDPEVVAEKSELEEGSKKRAHEDVASENKDESAVDSTDKSSKKKKQRRRQYDNDLPKETKSEDEEDDDEGEEEGNEDNLGLEEGEEDDLLEIDQSNIITSGRRTRGKVIDFTKAAEKLNSEQGTQDDENDEDDDGEFNEGDKEAAKETTK